MNQIPAPQVLAVAPAPSTRTLARLKRIPRLFWLTVVIPTTLATVYFGLIAADRYVSESRFVVRSPQRPLQAATFTALLQGTGFDRSQDDAYSVHDFILSRDALRELEKELQVSKAFGKTGPDFINHFPQLDFDDSFEALHRYYQKRVSVDYDSTSSVLVVRVNAFTAEDARRINQMLLDMSERLVNQISERARKDMIRFAAGEVREAERRAKEAALALATFRNQRVVVDPEKQSVIQLQQVAKLQEEIIATKTQLAQLRRYTPSNPQIPALETRLSTLQKEMDAETSKVAGGGGSLAHKAVGYEPLALERAFADKQLAAAMTALETARSEAQRKQLYLERIVQPNLPDAPTEPSRFRSVLVIFVVALIVWGILSLLMAGIREHYE